MSSVGAERPSCSSAFRTHLWLMAFSRTACYLSGRKNIEAPLESAAVSWGGPRIDAFASCLGVVAVDALVRTSRSAVDSGTSLAADCAQSRD